MLFYFKTFAEIITVTVNNSVIFRLTVYRLKSKIRYKRPLDSEEGPMTLEELEKRVKVIEDLEEIKKLHQKYIDLMDNLRYKEVLDLFTEDASVEVRNSGVLKGKEGLTDIYINKLGRRTARSEGHFVIEPDIVITGDSAKGTWLVYMLFSKPAVEWVQGRNEAEYARVGGKWKIKSMKFTRTNASKPEMFP
jgi:hypothetical protein